jgi:RNA polymerase sigma-70 factor (ECF subfamily)
MAIEAPRDRAEQVHSEEEARWSEWMVRANAGDAEAYAKLLAEIGGVMQQYLGRRFGKSDFIEDCVQECLLAIHRARATYDSARRFRPWMFTIVRHKAIDMLRRRGTRDRLMAKERGSEQPPARGADPLAALEAADALRELAPEYRDALLMTKLEGYSLEEAARKAGVSATAMKSRVHRGIKQVRRLLAREED